MQRPDKPGGGRRARTPETGCAAHARTPGAAAATMIVAVALVVLSAVSCSGEGTGSSPPSGAPPEALAPKTPPATQGFAPPDAGTGFGLPEAGEEPAPERPPSPEPPVDDPPRPGPAAPEEEAPAPPAETEARAAVPDAGQEPPFEPVATAPQPPPTRATPPPPPDAPPEQVRTEVASAEAVPPPAGGADDAAMYLTVPALGLEGVPVPSDSSEEAMDRGVIHVPGTGVPQQRGSNTYLAGHRIGYPGTGSDRVFWGLPALRKGDLVALTDHDGTAHEYRVTEALEVSPLDTWVVDPLPGREVVTLQTCIVDFGDPWGVGEDWLARYVVRADKV